MRSPACSEHFRPTRTGRNSAPPNISKQPCTYSTTSARALSILHTEHTGQIMCSYVSGRVRNAPLLHSPSIGHEDREERRTQLPAEQGIRDFGPLPRERYPLVAVLTLVEQDARDTYNIVCSCDIQLLLRSNLSLFRAEHESCPTSLSRCPSLRWPA